MFINLIFRIRISSLIVRTVPCRNLLNNFTTYSLVNNIYVLQNVTTNLEFCVTFFWKINSKVERETLLLLLFSLTKNKNKCFIYNRIFIIVIMKSIISNRFSSIRPNKTKSITTNNEVS